MGTEKPVPKEPVTPEQQIKGKEFQNTAELIKYLDELIKEGNSEEIRDQIEALIATQKKMKEHKTKTKERENPDLGENLYINI